MGRNSQEKKRYIFIAVCIESKYEEETNREKEKGGEREIEREKKKGNILAHIERQRQQGRDKTYENKERLSQH